MQPKVAVSPLEDIPRDGGLWGWLWVVGGEIEGQITFPGGSHHRRRVYPSPAPGPQFCASGISRIRKQRERSVSTDQLKCGHGGAQRQPRTNLFAACYSLSQLVEVIHFVSVFHSSNTTRDFPNRVTFGTRARKATFTLQPSAASLVLCAEARHT
jgi:hypothetical protein